MLFHADLSDQDERVNFQDASSTSMSCNNHELLTLLFNTNTDTAMRNDFSSILNTLYILTNHLIGKTFVQIAVVHTLMCV